MREFLPYFYKRERCLDCLSKYVEKKEEMIALSNADSYPGTVMIVSCDASFAMHAVLRPRWLVDATHLTVALLQHETASAASSYRGSCVVRIRLNMNRCRHCMNLLLLQEQVWRCPTQLLARVRGGGDWCPSPLMSMSFIISGDSGDGGGDCNTVITHFNRYRTPHETRSKS